MRRGLLVKHMHVSELTATQREYARRWSILNAWGWPDDLAKPETETERQHRARVVMDDAMATIGYQRCLAYWNSEEFMAKLPLKQEYGFRSSPCDG